jgi:8-oxo-dGTP pyrophosphatase MutT (NUDIX family)
MYVTYRHIQEAADKYGYPPVIQMVAPVDREEFEFIRSTQHYGRCHDVTMFIFKGQELLVIAKHNYPKGLYRPPSGAIKPGETLAEGALREAYEETGCEIELNRYILQVNVNFTEGRGIIPWRSHVFTGHHLSGDPHPVDTREIREVMLARLDEFEKYKRIIRDKTASGGLNYRARLHDEVLRLL